MECILFPQVFEAEIKNGNTHTHTFQITCFRLIALGGGALHTYVLSDLFPGCKISPRVIVFSENDALNILIVLSHVLLLAAPA